MVSGQQSYRAAAPCKISIMTASGDSGCSKPRLMTLFSRMTSAEGVYLNSIPIYDTHEHLAPCEAAREKETDILREYLRHYMASSVISAGLSQKDFLYVRDASKPLMERWNMVEPYWEYNRHTGYGQAVDISVKKLYGYSILPVRVIRLLLSMEMYKTTFHSCGIFPSPKIADAPLGPAVVRERLSKILEPAVSEHVCFHNLRHTFATTLLEYGMDVKTLSTIIDYNSVATTLNIYAHITDDMRVKTAVDFDHGIAKREQIMPPVRKLALENMTTFTAVKAGDRLRQSAR